MGGAVICDDCGREFTESPDTTIVAAGGWCAPTEIVYQMEDQPVLCGGCKARFLIALELGIDIGRDGENLRVPRGGIQFGGTDGA